MKHIHFDIEKDGFYGAYWKCKNKTDAGVIAMLGDDPKDYLAKKCVKWLNNLWFNVLTMSPGKKDYSHHNYPLERIEKAISFLKDNENKHENFADAVLMSYRSYVLQRENTDEYPYDDKYITKNGGPYNAGYVDEHLYDFWWGLSLHGVIYNTQFYRNTGLTLSEGVFYEDQEFSIIPMAYAESIYAYDKALYEYRVGDVNQSVSIESSLKRLDHYEKVIMKLIEAGRDAEHFSIGGKQLWFDKTSKFINDYLQLCLIRNTDKKQLRKRMKLFVSQIEKKNTDMYKCVNKNYKVFCMLNKMHMSDKVYQNYFIRLLHIVRH